MAKVTSFGSSRVRGNISGLTHPAKISKYWVDIEYPDSELVCFDEKIELL